MIVIDTSSLVAFLRNEPGADVVASNFDRAVISTVTLAETAGRMERDGIPSAQTIRAFRATPLEFVTFDDRQAEAAGSLIMQGRPKNVSFADCCCLALAIVRHCPVLTADRPWQALSLPIEVRLIR